MNLFTNNRGNKGQEGADMGKTFFVQVPAELWERIQQAAEIYCDFVDETVVMRYLKVGKKRLLNMIYSGKIKKHMYKVAVNGAKFFHLKKILGINESKRPIK